MIAKNGRGISFFEIEKVKPILAENNNWLRYNELIYRQKLLTIKVNLRLNKDTFNKNFLNLLYF
jgi:hypothetical protein